MRVLFVNRRILGHASVAGRCIEGLYAPKAYAEFLVQLVHEIHATAAAGSA